jgi:transcriptional regulator with XRE-family HTH domain
MNSKIAADERIHFRDRLLAVLRRANVSVRASTVAHEFNLRADGATVTTHAVRKWLTGDAIPTHERLLILSDWLGVHASWLLYGDAENTDFALRRRPSSLTSQDRMLVRDFNRLNGEGQRILREILDVLMSSMTAAAVHQITDPKQAP